MTATPYLLQLPDPDTAPARALDDGADTYLVVAESSADAKAMVQNYTRRGVFANVTPQTLAEATDMEGWRLRVRVTKADGDILTEQSVENAGQSEGKTFATGTLTISSTNNAVDGETCTIGTKVYTFQDTLTNVDGHIHIGADKAATLANLAHAINASGGTPGTDYALLNTVNADVTATVASPMVVTAKVEGTAGNAVATTETMTNGSWGNTTLTGGTSSTNKMSSLAELMVAALNASGVITGASFDDSTHTLTVAAIADGFGDATLEVFVYPPVASPESAATAGVITAEGVSVPGFVGSITDGGIAAAALTVVLAADTYGVPSLVVKSKAQE